MSKLDLLPDRKPIVQESSKEAKSVVGGLLGGLSERELKQIPISTIHKEPQVRREFPEDAHLALVENIRLHGVIEPIIVNTSRDNDKHFLVAGERRLLATEALQSEYEAAGDKELAEKFSWIPAIVYDDLTPEQIHEMQLSENLLREDLTALEEAFALADLLAVRLGVESDEVPSLLTRVEKEARGAARKQATHEEQLQVIEETFASYSSITWRTFTKERLHLFRLPDDILAAVWAKRLTSAQAEVLARLKDDPKSPETTKRMREMRKNLIEELERGMSVEDLARAIRSVTKKPDSAQAPEVRVALKVRRSLTPKRLLALPSESRTRVQELLEEVGRLLGDAEGKPEKSAPEGASAEAEVEAAGA